MKKHWLLIIGFALSISIVGFGSASYNKTINQKSTSSDSTINKEVVTSDNSKADLAKSNNIIDSKNVSSKEESSSTSTQQTQTITTSQTQSPTPSTTQSQNTTLDQTSNSTPTTTPTPTSTPTQTSTSAEAPVDKPTTTPSIPVQEKQTVNLNIQNIGEYRVDYGVGDTAWNIMIRAQQKYGFIMKYQDYGWGIYVTQLGNIPSEGTNYWALYHNGQSSMVGITDLKLQPNDTISWKYESWM